jgi:hypothetical protein
MSKLVCYSILRFSLLQCQICTIEQNGVSVSCGWRVCLIKIQVDPSNSLDAHSMSV